MFKTLGYYLSVPFIYGFSVLPMPILYAISNLYYVTLHGLIGYRRRADTTA